MDNAAASASQPGLNPEVTPFFDEATSTFSYVVSDPDSGHCAVVDSVMNFDQPSGTVSYESADQLVSYITRNRLTLDWLLETHVHADHLSAAPYIQQRLGGKIGIGQAITVVQETFAEIFNEDTSFRRDGSQFDALFADGDRLSIGGLTCVAMHTPGHTPACMSYLIGNAVFVGDTLFMPDSGTARVDFPGGDARTLYHSVKRLLSLPGDTRLFMCHDYCPGGRGVEYETTVAEQREANIHVNDSVSVDDFVKMREARDATLGMPALILPSLQVNMRGGRLPDADASGRVFLKLPINAFV